ncbi:hypothetical protein TNCV_3061481 [Trichonephila clavipes]|nr:hypothetical protein TNCV_3061481 [Trichonephila clavipes]
MNKHFSEDNKDLHGEPVSVDEAVSPETRLNLNKKMNKRTEIWSVIEAVGSIVVRASDSGSEVLGSMPDATKYPPSAHGERAR